MMGSEHGSGLDFRHLYKDQISQRERDDECEGVESERCDTESHQKAAQWEKECKKDDDESECHERLARFTPPSVTIGA